MLSSTELPFLNFKRSSIPHLIRISRSRVVFSLDATQQNLQLHIHRTCHHTYFQGITLSDAILLFTSSRHTVSILVPLAAFNLES